MLFKLRMHRTNNLLVYEKVNCYCQTFSPVVSLTVQQSLFLAVNTSPNVIK